MALIRMLISTKLAAESPAEDAFTNTLYFNTSGEVGQDPDYTALVNDLWAIHAASPFGQGRYVDVRAYNMDDDKPRPVKAMKRTTASGTIVHGPGQIAVALSYFADRNLPRQRGRIFLGPCAIGSTTASLRPQTALQNTVIAYGQSLAGLGGLNVDWSLYSPTNGTHTRISNIWCDDSWDVIRSRKLRSTSRVSATING